MYVGAVTSRSLYPGREGGGLPSFVYTGMCKYVLFSLNKNVWNCIQVYWINHLHDSVSRGLGPSIWSKLLLFRFRHSTQTQKVKRCLLVGPKDYLNLSWSISTWCGGMSDAELSSIQSSIACMCKYVHVYTRDMWISLYIYIYIYICIHMQKDVYIHTRRPIYTYMCIYIYMKAVTYWFLSRSIGSGLWSLHLCPAELSLYGSREKSCDSTIHMYI